MPVSGAFCLLLSTMMFNGRSAEPWSSFREGATNLDIVAWDSRTSKAARLITLGVLVSVTTE